MSTVRKEDFEALVVTVSLAAILALLTSFISFWETSELELPSWAPVGGKERWADPLQDPRLHVQQATKMEVRKRFEQGVVMLHAREYDHAIAAFHKVLEMAPKLPEAHMNLGYALLGLEKFGAAHDFFYTAIELRPMFANAYYGLGLALAGMEDYEAAMGAMRTYIHLSEPKSIQEQSNDPYLRKARSALWEWEQKLGRLPATSNEGVMSLDAGEKPE